MRFVIWMKLRCVEHVYRVDKCDRDYVGQVEGMRTIRRD